MKKEQWTTFVMLMVAGLVGGAIGAVHAIGMERVIDSLTFHNDILPKQYNRVLLINGLTGLIIGSALFVFTSLKRLGLMVLVGVTSYMAAGLLYRGVYVPEARYVFIILAVVVIGYSTRYRSEKETAT